MLKHEAQLMYNLIFSQF